ncbi:hypothetical protein SprV_0702396500 [Sparganum proliferum]
MSVRYFTAGMLILLVLSAESGDAYILSQSNAEADQQQNDDFGSENGEENDNSKVNGGFAEENDGEEPMLNDVDETGQKNIQYHDDDDSSDEEDDDDVGHHGGHDHEHDVEEEEDGEEEDFGDDIDEHHFADSGFDVDVVVHVGAHNGADEHHFGGHGEYDAEDDDDNDKDDDDGEEDRDMDKHKDEDHNKGNLQELSTGSEPLKEK